MIMPKPSPWISASVQLPSDGDKIVCIEENGEVFEIDNYNFLCESLLKSKVMFWRIGTKTPVFNRERVNDLNVAQQKGTFHPYTCCSTDNMGNECNRSEHEDGILLATEEGWICPCGKYTQGWAH